MSTTTAVDLAGSCEQMVRYATRLVHAVHHETPADVAAAIHAAHTVPCPAGVDPATVLTIVLAAMVDPSRGPERQLAWIPERAAHALLDGGATQAFTARVLGVDERQVEDWDDDARIDARHDDWADLMGLDRVPC